MTTVCGGCGLEVEGGTQGCQAIFEGETAREYGDVRFAGQRRMIVDSYCLKHPERYCVSSISFAAHLTGLCIAMEHHGREVELNAALQRWLSRRPALEKPPLPTKRGDLTIAGIRSAVDPATHRIAVERWASDVWAAYRDLQPLAWAWVAPFTE